MSRVLAYLRVSTSLQNLENQRAEIRRYADMRGIEVTDWIEMTMSSRRSDEQRRMKDVRELLTSGDTLVTTELSRLGRSVTQVISLIDYLTQKGVRVAVVKQGLVLGEDSDLASRIQMAVFAMLAEIERTLISDRVKMGLAVAKQNGKQLGRPVGSTGYRKLSGKGDQIKQLLGFKVSKRALARMFGVAPNTMIAFIKENGYEENLQREAES